MPRQPEHRPTLFTTVKVAADDPILLRPSSPLTVEECIAAARLLSAFPGDAALAAFARAVVTFRLTPEEFAQIKALAAEAAKRN